LSVFSNKFYINFDSSVIFIVKYIQQLNILSRATVENWLDDRPATL